MHKPAKDKHFIKQPWYEGGIKALKLFIAQNMRYPEGALAQKVEGTVTVRYDIDHRGEVMDAKILGHTLGHGCDEEAIRLVKSLKFKVERPRGLRVIYHKTIQIHFKLPQTPPQPAAIQVNYNYVESKKKEKPEPNSEGSGYSITINWG